MTSSTRFTTTQCRRFGHPEISFRFRTSPPVPRLEQMLLGYFESQVAAGTVFAPGQTVLMGWAPLMLSDRGDGTLGVLERDMTLDRAWVDSVDTALMQTWFQKEVVASVGLVDRVAFPQQDQTAIVCRRVRDVDEFYLSRTGPQDNDSGWFVGCADESHDHQATQNLGPTQLYSIAVLFPALTQFFALPPGCDAIVATRGRARAELYLDGRRLTPTPGSYLAALADRR